jgi:hypothetical protein
MSGGTEGDCGCEKPNQRREQLFAGEVLGDRWKDVVEDVVMKRAGEVARAQLESQEEDGDEDILVRVPTTLYITFPRSLPGDPVIICSCSNMTFPDGSGICVCSGKCDFDACCD